MNMDTRQHSDEAVPADTLTLAAGASLSNPSRRRFNRAGLGASGVILTLACKPVLGGVVCKSPSGFLSGNQSVHDTGALCNGRSPDYWKQTASWPMSKKTKFAKMFGCNAGSPFEQCTLAEMIAGHEADTQKLCMYLTAALLNARSGWTPFLSEETIQAIYLEWRNKGYFTPTANVQWMAADIVNYLRATQA